MPHPLYAASPSPEDGVILDPTEVIDLLKRLMESHASVEVSPDEGAHRYTGLITDVDATSNRFCLGELNPPPGESELAAGQLVSLSARLPDGAISFHASALEWCHEDGIGGHYVELPRLVHILQRRRHPRTLVGEHHDIEVLVSANGRPSITGKLADLSVGGMAVHVNEHDAEEFGLWMGETVKITCILPSGHKLHCDFGVRYARLLPSERLLFGGDFFEPTSADQQAITEYSVLLQRELSEL
jgi:c-di-GMP-binding flagellar brake protein YcgR